MREAWRELLFADPHLDELTETRDPNARKKVDPQIDVVFGMESFTKILQRFFELVFKPLDVEVDFPRTLSKVK